MSRGETTALDAAATTKKYGARWLALASLVAVSACSGSGVEATTSSGGELDGVITVFAAASLTNVFDELVVEFEAQNPGVEVRVSFAGSSSLREQILEGAPADVYASANTSNMETVSAADGLRAPAAVFASNRLQIAVPADNPGDVAGLGDLSRPELLVGLCAVGVPCGDLARQALDAAGVTAELDTNELDVRALLTKIEVGELDVGIVYATDILAAGTDVVGLEPVLEGAQAEYPIAVLRDSTNPGAADAFVKFVLSPAGVAVLSSHGFGTP